ncbi:MAG TPA: STAS domain-containing protein [Solirubrobacteraceae bacterium]|jgi:anti-anti-sigma factor|nr:STAS domain-containing protein [Solirubrobacteraceae bacterium]
MSGDAKPFEVRDVVRDGLHTLVLSGELDIAPATDLEARVLELCAAGAGGIVIDLSRLTFMGSTGVRLILSAREMCAQHGCDFFIVPGPPSVQRLFELTGLLESLPFTTNPGGDEAADTDTLEMA